MASSMKEVARRAGVSAATVSHVINKTRYVNPETKERVLQAVEGLNYVPNAAAKSLKSKEAKVIKVIMPSNNAQVGEKMNETLIKEMLPFWNDRKYTLSLHQIDYTNPERFHDIFLHTVDGLIILFPNEKIYNSIKSKATNIPFVFLEDGMGDDDGVSSIRINHYEAIFKQVDQLIKQNKTSLYLLQAQAGQAMNEACEKAFKDAFKENGIEVESSRIRSIPASAESGYVVAHEWMKNNDVDAIICNNETLSLGLIRYMVERGLQTELVLYKTTLDWNSLYEYVQVIHVPYKEIALKTGEVLFQLLDKDFSESQSHTFKTETHLELAPAYSLKRANEYILENEVDTHNSWYPAYHIAPPVGWLNDPNGLVHYKDEYHVFYQYHPYGGGWGPIHWGHVKSKDLIHWEHQPVALAPDQSYESGCFSGSALEYEEQMLLYYTSHDDNNVMKEVQSLAHSVDGINFQKVKENPIVKNISGEASPDFRDPKVWIHDGIWYMIIGTSKNGDARAVLYRSNDGKDWQYFSIVAEGGGKFGDFWECPDLFKLGNQDILMISSMRLQNQQNIFLFGDFDYATGKLENYEQHVFDYGRDFYAGQTFLDKQGRRILIGWMARWGVKNPTEKEGWVGCLTLPREIKANAEGDIIVYPVEETKLLRQNLHEIGDVKIEDDVFVPSVRGSALEIMCELVIGEQLPDEFGIKVRKSKKGDEFTDIKFNVADELLKMDLTASGKGDSEISEAPLQMNAGDIIKIRIFVDKSSVELFINDGKINITNRIYPKDNSTHLAFYATNGQIDIKDLKFWELKNIWT